MNEKKLLSFYGLKYNPFLPSIPVEDLWMPPGAELFFSRIENILLNGGFCLICGDTGLGKSKILQLLAARLDQLNDVVVGVMERPQSTMNDFYRELGALFGVNLTPANRYGGFKALRSRWRTHLKSTLFRPVLIIDEAQEVPTKCLNELRLLGSAHFDSECLLTTILSGDHRLPERFMIRELVPLGSRVRTRMMLASYRREELDDFLDHMLDRSAGPQLMSEGLRHTLCDHSAGNLRVLSNMAAELLAAGLQRQLPSLDEKLFIEIFSHKDKPRRQRAVIGGRGK